MKHWARMPSKWIGAEKNLLQDIVWGKAGNGDVVSALMLYIVLVQHANDEATYERAAAGWSMLTYDEMSQITSLSRAKVASGLGMLDDWGLIKRSREGRRTFCEISGYGTEPWAKLPSKGIYDAKLRTIPAFREFRLRNKFELHALKLYLMIIARRDRKTNLAHLTYEQFENLTAVRGADIKRALMFLSFSLNLLIVERIASNRNPERICHAYRLVGLEARKHLGTIGSRVEFDLTSDIV